MEIVLTYETRFSPNSTTTAEYKPVKKDRYAVLAMRFL